MRVITLAGSPRFPSRSSALLEYAREKLTALDVEVCHWNLHNFAPEDLLYARFDSPALKTLNAAMKLRGETQGGFSTVDLALMQRQGGCVELYKCGAAPSYLKRGGSVRRFCSDAPPTGLSSSPLPPDQVHIPVQAGDYLVLISDGIADQSCDEWLLNLLAGWNGCDPDELTALILAESRSRKGLADDCAVAVLHLPFAGENRKTAV